MALERIVRPFQLNQNTLPTPVIALKSTNNKPVVLKIGLTGKGKVLSGSYSVSESYYLAQAASEERHGF